VQLLSALVADADRSRNAVLRSHLEASGWRVRCAYDGPAALSALRSEEVRLVIVQCALPGMDGIAVVRAALANGQSFHAVFLDTAERPWFRPQCVALGALVCMTTPLSTQELDGVIKGALQRPPLAPGPRDSSRASALEPNAGDRVRLVIAAGPSVGSYPAVIVDRRPASLIVSAWEPDGGPIYVSLGTAATVGFPTNSGWGEVQSQVTGSYIGDSVIEITLSRIGRPVYTQRRRSERFSIALPVHAWPARARDAAGAMVAGHTEDIGLKGLRARFAQSLAQRGLVVLAVSPIAGAEEARLLGQRVWHEAAGEPGHEVHRYGFHFVRLALEAVHRLDTLLARVGASAIESQAAEPYSHHAEGGPGPPGPLTS